jgi:rhamnose utilization protein RhaD (predicted bifunctional aldolase and dehydrogenase)/NAD(P)-dependent dehydrogenase (short-subunit alcohol dehydrogenase family)
MKSLWSDKEAKEYVARYAERGVAEDMALRVYTTRLLGGDPNMVLHGGGNTSVKTVMRDTIGDPVDVICVKGSGWDMGNIEPPGLPAMKLNELRRLRKLDKLSDEEMVNFQRINLLDAAAPNPSVETLLHAFLPHKFVDHSHSSAVVSITDQEGGDDLSREVFGENMAYVGYHIPGFTLSKWVADAYEKNPKVQGIILLRHGIFTFSNDARSAYELMLEMVTRAEDRIKRGKKTIVQAKLPKHLARMEEITPILRGAVALENDRTSGTAKRQVLDFRVSEKILNYVNGAEVGRYSQIGVATPDHTIRTKDWPVVLPAPEAGKLDIWTEDARAAVQAFVEKYKAYFARHNPAFGGNKKMLDPYPRVALVPGVGLFGMGANAKDAAIAADIAENTVDVITAAESISSFASISEADMFEIEYWSLEQAKLGKSVEKPLARQVALITGAGSGIGAATARAFAKAGAEVAIVDRDMMAAQKVAHSIGFHALPIECDVTKPESVTYAMEETVRTFGGIDIVVSNAGAAWQGRIGAVREETLRESFELNFFAHQTVAQAAVKVMVAQGTGGCMLFNTSKQAVNPGKDFGPYGLPKAATMFLVKQYALDHGKDGIRANAVNADRIRSGLLTDEMIAERAKKRGLSEADYMGGNLLGREVTAEDVADAFVFLAQASKTTAAIVTVDGGNIEASLR